MSRWEEELFLLGCCIAGPESTFGFNDGRRNCLCWFALAGPESTFDFNDEGEELFCWVARELGWFAMTLRLDFAIQKPNLLRQSCRMVKLPPYRKSIMYTNTRSLSSNASYPRKATVRPTPNSTGDGENVPASLRRIQSRKREAGLRRQRTNGSWKSQHQGM